MTEFHTEYRFRCYDNQTDETIVFDIIASSEYEARELISRRYMPKERRLKRGLFSSNDTLTMVDKGTYATPRVIGIRIGEEELKPAELSLPMPLEQSTNAPEIKLAEVIPFRTVIRNSRRDYAKRVKHR